MVKMRQLKHFYLDCVGVGLTTFRAIHKKTVIVFLKKTFSGDAQDTTDDSSCKETPGRAPDLGYMQRLSYHEKLLQLLVYLRRIIHFPPGQGNNGMAYKSLPNRNPSRSSPNHNPSQPN